MIEYRGTPVPCKPKPPLGALGWIAAYKVIKALLALIAGIGMLKLQNYDLTLLARKGIRYFDIDPNGKFATDLLARVLRINDRRLRLVGGGFFFYSVLYTVEGIGLFLRKRWAEWLTVVATCLLIPLEVYEVARRLTPLRIFVLVFNLLLVAYLCWRLKRDAPCEKKQILPESGVQQQES